MRHSIILNIQQDITLFKWDLLELDMPMFDIEAVLSALFGCFLKENDFAAKLHELCVDMSERDALFENEHLDQDQQERVYRAFHTLGTKIKLEYDLAKVFVDGQAPYHYTRTFHGCALLVAEFPLGFCDTDYRTRHARSAP